VAAGAAAAPVLPSAAPVSTAATQAALAALAALAPEAPLAAVTAVAAIAAIATQAAVPAVAAPRPVPVHEAPFYSRHAGQTPQAPLSASHLSLSIERLYFEQPPGTRLVYMLPSACEEESIEAATG